MINVIIPLAGDGNRFAKKNFIQPKPLIKINKLTLIETAIKTLDIKNGIFYFVRKKYKNTNFNNELDSILKKYTKKKNIIVIKQTLNGPVRSCMQLKKKMKKNYPLIIANCDQYLKWNSDNFINFFKKNNYDGGFLTFKSKNKKNSFVKLNKNNYAIYLKEKKVISNHALVGVHYWKKTSFFFNSAKKYLKIRKNKEAFISETYNLLIKEKKKIGLYDIKKNCFSLIGTPKDLITFRKKNIC